MVQFLIKFCFKTFVTWIIELHNFLNIWSRNIVQIVLNSLQEEQHGYKQKVWKFWKVLLSRGTWKKMNFSTKRCITLKTPDMKPGNLPFWKNSSFLFVWKPQRIECTFLSISLLTEWVNMNEYIVELWCFWRILESHYSFSNGYVSVIISVTEWWPIKVLKMKFWALYVPLGKISLFSSALGLLKFRSFS